MKNSVLQLSVEDFQYVFRFLDCQRLARRDVDHFTSPRVSALARAALHNLDDADIRDPVFPLGLQRLDNLIR